MVIMGYNNGILPPDKISQSSWNSEQRKLMKFYNFVFVERLLNYCYFTNIYTIIDLVLIVIFLIILNG